MGQFRRRQFLAASGVLFAAPLACYAQPPQTVRRIGVLSIATPAAPFSEALRDRLRRLGYEEGKNLVIEWRLAAGDNERLPTLARELVRLNPELIIAHQNEALAAIKQVTRSIPIVMVGGFMPVEHGFVESLARPGGNITGAAWIGPEHMGKVIEVVRLAAPNAVRIAVTPPFFFADLWKAEVERAAGALRLEALYFPIARREDAESALERIAAARPDALCIGGDAVTLSLRGEIAAFAIRQKLFSISPVSSYADSGLLMSHGPNVPAIFDRTAYFVDRILRGARPADLPVELPTKYELTINARTARAIGYSIPPSLLARADRVIE